MADRAWPSSDGQRRVRNATVISTMVGLLWFEAECGMGWFVWESRRCAAADSLTQTAFNAALKAIVTRECVCSPAEDNEWEQRNLVQLGNKTCEGTLCRLPTQSISPLYRTRQQQYSTKVIARWEQHCVMHESDSQLQWSRRLRHTALLANSAPAASDVRLHDDKQCTTYTASSSARYPHQRASRASCNSLFLPHSPLLVTSAAR